jgi:hypothetical protein
MSPITLKLKFDPNLIITIIGVILIMVAVIHAGRTLILLNRAPKTTTISADATERTLQQALDLLTTQTNSN